MNRDHPRVGGEKFHSAAEIDEKMGSPPHRRGKDVTSAQAQSQVGITPAWAGKRSTPPHGGWCRHNHPRMGGEKNFSFCISNLTRGSPPHGRGKAGKNGGCDFGDRITPAWAGKSFVLRLWCVATQDHPRMGGEKFVYKNKTADQVGSPPHGRGKATSLVEIEYY